MRHFCSECINQFSPPCTHIFCTKWFLEVSWGICLPNVTYVLSNDTYFAYVCVCVCVYAHIHEMAHLFIRLFPHYTYHIYSYMYVCACAYIKRSTATTQTPNLKPFVPKNSNPPTLDPMRPAVYRPQHHNFPNLKPQTLNCMLPQAINCSTTTMGWLRLVGSLKLQVSFVE